MRDDVDLDKGTIGIRLAIGRENGKLGLTPTKSKSSRRTVHIDPETVRVLSRHLAAQAEHRLRVGPAYSDRGLLFATPFGAPIEPSALTKAWGRLCKEGGVKFRLHDLRHHHATALIEAGVHIKTVQTRLGHNSPALTLRVYGHVSPGMDREAADVYAKAMSE